MVTHREGGGYGLDAQWSDDFHHAVHVALTGETDGYYADFAPLGALAKVLNSGFFHDGSYSSFRGREHGRPVDTDPMPTWRLVVCAQNHDQIGNRARGDRTAEHLDPSRLLCAALLTLGSPFTPMLFQGEEWAASTPFAFFTSHPEPELAKATAEGRLAEFERMGWDPDQVLDPQDPATYSASNLRWEESAVGHHAQVLEGYRRLAALRRQHPELTDPSFGRATADEAGRRLTLERGRLAIHLNLGEEEWTGGRERGPLQHHRRRAVGCGRGVGTGAGRRRPPRRQLRAGTGRGVSPVSRVTRRPGALPISMDFTTYVAQRRTRLVRTAVLLGCPRADAEDIVQTALLKCYRSWRRVARADRPDAYVHRVLVTTLADARARRWHGELPTENLPEEADDLDPTGGIAVRRALAALSPEHREVLVLRFYADLSERDTAVALGVAPGTVKSRTSRALAALAPLVEAP